MGGKLVVSDKFLVEPMLNLFYGTSSGDFALGPTVFLTVSHFFGECLKCLDKTVC